MRFGWTRPALVTALAGATLLGAGVALGPWREPGPARPPAAAAPTTPAHGMQRYVDRTTARLARVPGDWQAWARLGMAHLELARATYDPGHYPAAEAALRRSLAVRPADNAAALTGLGALAAARHDFATAEDFARRAAAIDAYSADAYGVLTDALVELGRYPQAADAVHRMLRLRPDTGSYARASYLAELHGDIVRATALMRRARDLAAGPDDITFTQLHLGELAFGAGDLSTAAGHFAAGLARRPTDPGLLAGRARVTAARGDLPSAIADLRVAAATLPSIDHLVTLAEALTAAGDADGAARTEDLISVSDRLRNPGATAGSPATTDIDVVLFHADHGEPGTAVEQGRALLAVRPGVGVQTAYAWALHAAGRDREALAHADRGLRLGTRDAKALHHRAMIRQALGDEAGARRDLTDALRINPYFSLRYAPEARAVLSRLRATT